MIAGLLLALLSAETYPMRVKGDWRFKSDFSKNWRFQKEEEVDYGYGLIALVKNHHLRRMVDSLTLAPTVGPRTE